MFKRLNKNDKSVYSYYVENKHKVFRFLGLKLKFKLSETEINFQNKNIVTYNNSIVLPKNISCFFHCNGRNNNVEICQSSELDCCRGSIAIHVHGSNTRVFIDEGLKIRGHLIINVTENCEVLIGKECLIADFVEIFTTDFHRIYDKVTKELINSCKSVFIGNHCWLCRYVRILKGSKIPDNCVVGINSVVNKAFNLENSVIAGIPARIVKKNITWED